MEVPIKIVGASVYVVGEVNGHPCLFIIDTGDAVGPVFNVIDARRLGLKPASEFQVSGAGGSSTSYATKADVKLGMTGFEGEAAAIDPYLAGASLLGLPFFLSKCAKLTFDFENSKLIMSSATPSDSGVPVSTMYPYTADEGRGSAE